MSWKKGWIKQRKKDQRKPEFRSFKYQCTWGHIRIEKEKLSNEALDCPACNQEGKSSKFRYIGVHTLTRTDAKKSKFNK